MEPGEDIVDLCVVTCSTAVLRHLHILLLLQITGKQLKCEMYQSADSNALTFVQYLSTVKRLQVYNHML